MTTITACLSMLHEAHEHHSATRLFRARPVLDWTLSRLNRSESIDSLAVLCWEDQMEVVRPIADRHNTHVLAKGPRVALPQVLSVAAARRWADGWRGGLLGTCDFDQGFYAPWLQEIVARLASDALLLVDPASGLVDPCLLDELVDYAASHTELDFCFTQAAPGLGGVLLRSPLIDQLANGKAYPGLMLQYRPDQPARDPIGTDRCMKVATSIARTSDRFKLDSDRQVARLERATLSLNGTLIATPAEQLVLRTSLSTSIEPMPREVTLELTPRRLTRPIFSPLSKLKFDRPDLTPMQAAGLFDELSAVDDLRLTLAGVGDPMLHGQFMGIVAAAREVGIEAIHVETDLLELSAGSIEQLAGSAIDVISVHLPAANVRTYQNVMNHDGLNLAMNNLRRLADEIARRNSGTPLIVPIFTKCNQNLQEMEACYDHWLRTLGHCVIAGPSDYCQLIPSAEVADMAPARRTACKRLESRMTILSDGTVVACEQDVTALQPLGKIQDMPIKDIWQKQLAPVREAHALRQWDMLETCRRCRQWHRP